MDTSNEINITIPFKLFSDNACQPSENKDNIKFLFPFVDEGSIDLWRKINSLFLQFYPTKFDKKEISPVDSVFYQKEEREIIEKLGKQPPSQWNEEVGEESHLTIEKIRKMQGKAPRGYLQFLISQYTKTLSADLDHLVFAYPDFWRRLPINYWKEGIEIYDKAIKLIESLTELRKINEKQDFGLATSNSNKKSTTIKLQFEGTGDIKIDEYWRNLIICGILNEAQDWFDEAKIPINVWGQSSDEAREILTKIRNERTTMKKDNPEAYVTGNLIQILDWPGANEGNSTADSAEFIMRFLVTCELTDDKYKDMIENLDRYYNEAPKDQNGRPLKNTSYYGERREISERIRNLNNAYKNLTITNN